MGMISIAMQVSSVHIACGAARCRRMPRVALRRFHRSTQQNAEKYRNTQHEPSSLWDSAHRAREHIFT